MIDPVQWGRPFFASRKPRAQARGFVIILFKYGYKAYRPLSCIRQIRSHTRLE